jgi:serine protease inhibitor
VAAPRAWLVTRAAAVVGLAALLAGCSVVIPDASLVRAAPPASAPAAPEPDVAAAVRGSTALALALYQRLGSGDENLVASPSSLATVLAMALPGARGRTAEEIARVLHTTLDPGRLAVAMGTLDAAIGQRASASNAAELDVSNVLWSQRGYTIRPAFLELLAGAFRSGVHQADFIADTERARLAINALVQQQTNGKIKDLFARGLLNDLTRLVLTNAIYLKARWQQPFDPHDTWPAPFHTLDGDAPNAPTMHQQAITLPYARGDGWQAVELAYKGGALAMGVLLPAAGNFASFQQGLSPDRLAAVLGALRPTTLGLALPKFSFDSTHQLNQTLAALGMPTAFTDAADFSGIFVVSEPLKVQTVVQKAHVAVDEEGTTAAAATGMAIRATSAVIPPVRMNVDRPFVFLLRDLASGQVLFLGRVTDPRQL